MLVILSGKALMRSDPTSRVGRNGESRFRRSEFGQGTWWKMLRYSALHATLTFTLVLVLSACSGDPGTGPVEVKWDRDACARCNMVLSDRRHAAQIRYQPTDGSRGQLKKFDDLGCAVLWLDQQPWRDQAGVEVWVKDHDNGSWINARAAHYKPGSLTPMQYGLAAQSHAEPGTLVFAKAREHIYAVEARFNVHGGNLDHAHTSPPASGETPPARAQ